MLLEKEDMPPSARSEAAEDSARAVRQADRRKNVYQAYGAFF